MPSSFRASLSVAASHAGIAVLVLAGLLAGSVAVTPGSARHAQAACPAGAATAQPAQGGPATPAVQGAIPTQVAVQPEQNPPGDIPDNQAFVTYTSTAGGYSISMPEGWARTESGPNVQFTDKLHTFSVEIACSGTAPTTQTAKDEASGPLAQQSAAFAFVAAKDVSLSSGPAVLLQYQANSAPDEVTGKQVRLDIDRYEIYRDGTLAIVSLAVPAGSDNVDVSHQVSDSFKWTT